MAADLIVRIDGTTHATTDNGGIRCDILRQHAKPLSGDAPVGTWDWGEPECHNCAIWPVPPPLLTGASTAKEDQ